MSRFFSLHKIEIAVGIEPVKQLLRIYIFTNDVFVALKGNGPENKLSESSKSVIDSETNDMTFVPVRKFSFTYK